MTQRQWVGVGLAIIILIVLIFVVQKWDVRKANIKNEEGGVNKTESVSENASKDSEETKTFTREVPKDAKITSGVVEAPAAPGATSEKLRVYDVKIGSSGYSPSEIVVNQGDSVNMRLSAEGGDFDLSIPDLGLKMFVPKGENRTVAFQALVRGVFTFLCADACPKEGIIKGTLIVK